jgi:adenine-specific DNA-methyltransferase
VSRLTDLIAQAKTKDSSLGTELDREIRALSSRRAFGLNFERHRPEVVELPGRPIRKGDKVRILPERGAANTADRSLWTVKAVSKVDGTRFAVIESASKGERGRQSVAVGDLVCVAEFRDLIYPGLVSTGKIQSGGDKPYHIVINGENYHALKALTYTHRGRVDLIYIDPPYNTRDKDWKYNNDYVDSDDQYKHSKWLAMMERRLKVAQDLLKPTKGALIVTIDENEVHRLGLLLEQLFPEAAIQMITTVISAKGAVRPGKFSRVEEYIFVVAFGPVRISPWFRNMLDPVENDGGTDASIEWLGLRRREPSSVRGARPNQFYPIFVRADTGYLHSIGEPLTDDVERESIEIPTGAVALWPLKPNGTEMLWGLTPDVLRRNWSEGFARVNSWKPTAQIGTVQYLPGGTIDLIRNGTIRITGRARDGSVIGTLATDEDAPPPKRVWNLPSHNGEIGGTNLLSTLLPGRRFPYPKSLYAVEDLLRFFIGEERDAVVLDFFAGSGTTAHAVMRLNRQDDGRRQCIIVTNNEVAADEQASLRQKGLRPGDSDWEALGICDYITKPRVAAAINGRTPEGDLIDAVYKYTDELPISQGFAENTEFFTFTYETSIAISHNLAFQRIAPLLWMRAGSTGKRIDVLPTQRGWDVADTYALLIDLDRASKFFQALGKANNIRVAFIVTDDDRRFQSVIRRLPDYAEPVRLYESYLTNFRFTAGE